MSGKKNALRLLVVMGVLGWAGTAMSPEQKREILSTGLSAMTRAIDTVKGAPLTTEQDRTHLNRLQADLQEKSDELMGVNGFDRVPDNQLNAFSTYVVQDMEQADKTITVSLVVVLLIVIIIILIA